MNRFFQAHDQALSFERDSETILSLGFGEIPAFGLELAMLLTNVAEKVVVSSGRRGASMVLTVARTDEARATVLRQTDGRRHFVLPDDQARVVLEFLLIAHRDGSADVNHIHIQGDLEGASHDLTVVVVGPVKPAVPADKLAKLLARNKSGRRALVPPAAPVEMNRAIVVESAHALAPGEVPVFAIELAMLRLRVTRSLAVSTANESESIRIERTSESEMAEALLAYRDHTPLSLSPWRVA